MTLCKLPLGILFLGSVVVSAVTTAMVFNVNFVTSLRGPGPPVPSSDAVTVEVNYILSMVFSAAMDVTLTTFLTFFLFRSRSSAATNRFRKVLYGLIAITWESALPPCVCAIATLVVFVRWAEHNYWNLVFQAILGKLYVISLLFTLNSRTDLRARVRANELELPEIYWTSLPQIREDAREASDDPVEEESASPVTLISQNGPTRGTDEKDWYEGDSRHRCRCCPSESSTPV